MSNTMTKPTNVIDLDQAVFFVYPDSEAIKIEYENSKNSNILLKEKEFMMNKLKSLWEEIQEIISSLASEYFWHDEGIHWEVIDKTANPFNAFISGKIRFGDGIEDEWFVLRLLKVLTKQNYSLVCSIFDTDGDFILIEGAEVLPEWLEPENSKNRVFIHEGSVKIIPIEKFKTEPSLQEALKFVRSVCPVHEEINEVIKVKVFDEQKLHKARVRIPLKIAKILTLKKQLVGAAISSFYNREPESMKACALMNHFNPWKSGGPMVLTTIPMTRIQFAQLACQEFIAPSNDFVNFDMKSCENPVAAELGMKLTCGFEILISNDEPKFISKNIFEELSNSVQDEIENFLGSQIEGNFICDETEDDLSWMEISEDFLDSELKSKLSLNEVEKTELIDVWTREFESGNGVVNEMKEELTEIDKIVENMKKMIESTSNFEGIEHEGDGKDDYSDSENEDSFSNSYDSSNSSDSDDELFIEREIFETINFDPDLLMKILEANAHMGVSSEEFLQRFRKYQADNPVTSEERNELKSKQKGLADIDEAKLNEARKSSRKFPVKESNNADSDASSEAESILNAEPNADCEVGDEFIYGQTFDQLRRSAQIESEITDEKELYNDSLVDEKSPSSPNISDYYDAMDRELQSELKQYTPDLDETSNLGKNMIESMMAGKGGSANPMETVISGLGKKIPRS
jgi:hypothetical protein